MNIYYLTELQKSNYLIFGIISFMYVTIRAKRFIAVIKFVYRV